MKIFPKKSMFNTSKVKRSPEFVWRLPDGICRLDPKSKKYYRNAQLSTQNANFPKKKYVQNLKKEKEQQICMGAPRRNVQARPKILKKLPEHQIYQ
jgi:hypothetical protein